MYCNYLATNTSSDDFLASLIVPYFLHTLVKAIYKCKYYRALSVSSSDIHGKAQPSIISLRFVIVSSRYCDPVCK